jgi:glucose-6-phosphate isomerase/general stress protein 13
MDMKYSVGQIVEGVVTGIQAYGAFVQLDTETTGLIHISELSEAYVKDISLFVKVKDVVKVKVLDIDEKTHQVRLSYKAIHDTPRKSRPKPSREKQGDTLGFSTLAQALPSWINSAKKEKP